MLYTLLSQRDSEEGMKLETVRVERLDHLGLVAGVIKDLGIIESIDARIPTDEMEKITTGEAVAGMILK